MTPHRDPRVLVQHRRATELFTLDTLADEFAIHPRTLLAASTAALAPCGEKSINWASPKKTEHADEQGRPDVVAERRRWHEGQPLHDVRQHVFLDECGVTTDL